MTRVTQRALRILEAPGVQEVYIVKLELSVLGIDEMKRNLSHVSSSLFNLEKYYCCMLGI